MAKKTFHVRITDEWTADKSVTVYSIQFVTKNGERLIRVQNLINKGKYEALLLGMSIHGFFQWINNDPTDAEPELYNEIYDDRTKEWRRMLSREQLLGLLGE
jgi:hypothetical protein